MTLKGMGSIWTKLQAISPFGSVVALTATSNLLGALLALVSGVLTARILNSDGRGELAVIQLWPTFIVGFSLLGIPDALVYYCARQRNHSASLLATAMATALALSFPFLVFSFLILPILLVNQDATHVRASQQYLLLLPIQAVVGMLYQPLRGTNDLVRWNLLRLFPSIMWILVIVGSIALGQADPVSLSRNFLIGLTALLIPMAYVVGPRLAGPYRFTRNFVPLMLNYGVQATLARGPTAINARLDQLLIAAYLDTRMLGLYVIAVSWSAAIAPLLNALSDVLLPRVAALPDLAPQGLVLSQVARFSTVLVLVVTALAAVVTPYAIYLLFGPDFAEAVPACLILLFASAVTSLKQLFATGAMGLGKPKYSVAGEFVGMVVTIALLPGLLNRLGIVGAALTSLASYGVSLLVLVVLISNYTSIKISRYFLITASDVKLVSKVAIELGRLLLETRCGQIADHLTRRVWQKG